MSSALTDESPAEAKGLSSGTLGLWGNTVIGLASTAPAYSLAATLGYVVLAVGEKSPAMFLIAFVPMLLVAIAYRELNSVMPDCGTTFTWGAKALGPAGWAAGVWRSPGSSCWPTWPRSPPSTSCVRSGSTRWPRTGSPSCSSASASSRP